MPGLLTHRTVQVHPSLFCNLRCLHCYSSSSPEHRSQLSVADLVARLSYLEEEGYEVASFSGGEPLAFIGLAEVLERSHEIGLRNNLITNGTLLTARRLEELQPYLSGIAVSVDGASERHDRMRGKAGRLDKTIRAFGILRDAGMPFGISHCVTRETIQDLPWLAKFAIEQGASALQIHPLTEAGRASSSGTTMGATMALTSVDRLRVALITALLRMESADELTIQLDLIHRRELSAIRNQAVPRDGQLLSDLINPLVLDEQGQFWPFAYGMHASQRLAAFQDWKLELEQQKATRAPRLRHLLERTCSSIAEGAGDWHDWYGELLAESGAS